MFVAVLPGVALASWVVRRAGVSGARKWSAGLAVALTSFALPAVIAILHAVPFAVERSLARTIERSAPLASDWMVDLGAGQMARLLGVAQTDTAIDVGRLSARIATAQATAQSQGPPEPWLDRVRWYAVTESLGAMQAAAARLPPMVSWADLIQATKSIMRTQVSWLHQGVRVTLDTAAAANVASAAIQVAVSHAFTLLVVAVLLWRPAPASVG